MDLISPYIDSEVPAQRQGDRDGVRAWRTQQLGRLGLPWIVAESVADHVDWHSLADLVERGCPLGLALEIVR